MKKLFVVMAVLCFLCLNASAEVATKATVTVKVNDGASLISNRKLVTGGCFQGYNINGNNYFRLRDVAYLFKVNNCSFGVDWNEKFGQVEITTGKYFWGELDPMDETSDTETAEISTDKLVIDGKHIENITAYKIRGNNYYKLRDLCDNLGCHVSWLWHSNTICINPLIENAKFVSNANGRANTVSGRASVNYGTIMIDSSDKYGNTFMYNLRDNKDGTITDVYFIDRNIFGADLRDAETFEVISSKEIELELPVFGGVYLGENYNYLVVGQENMQEDDSCEVIRIIKYDKNFNRISSLSLNGGDTYTTDPFNSGTVNMSENGNELVVHTSRLRYTSEDGIRHQSNLTIVINTDTMQVTNGLGSWQDETVGHSFNQLVRHDNGSRVITDLGDATPRAVVLAKFADGYYNKVNLLDIPGKTGANCTGVGIGGFEAMQNNYVVSVNSIDHSKVTEYTDTEMIGLEKDERNVILLITDKNNFDAANVRRVVLTDYINNNKTASRPYLVKLDDSRLLVMWMEFELSRDAGVLKYVQTDENGNMLTEIKTGTTESLGRMCYPKLIGDKVVWYNAGWGVKIFFEIPIG